jgi:hypothetical protein
VIGGNVWLTHSVEAGNKVYYNDGDELHESLRR